MRRTLTALLLAITLLSCIPATQVLSQRAASTQTQPAGNPDVKVWVNTASGVYHCPGAYWYGNTKRGEYMTQKDAQKKGNRPARGKVCQ
jgi:hypothetical protein